MRLPIVGFLAGQVLVHAVKGWVHRPMVVQAGPAVAGAALQIIVALEFGRNAGGLLGWEAGHHLPEPHSETPMVNSK